MKFTFQQVITLTIVLACILVSFGALAFSSVLLAIGREPQSLYVTLMSATIGVWMGAAANAIKDYIPSSATTVPTIA